MRSCICLFYIWAFAPAVLAQSADALYADRANPSSAVRAAELWSADVARNPKNFEAAWKLARVMYWLGNHAPASERRAYLERGVEAGRKAALLQPTRPEGYFWMGADMGTLAESFGIRAGLKYRKPVKEAFEAVLRIDPAFQRGSADRALGRWYFKVPRLFGGSNEQAEAHLRASLTYDERSPISHYFLAEVLIDEGREQEARAELEKVIAAPPDPEWNAEDEGYRAQARTLLQRLK
jgi:tetratricopeptide (TPR) repeat protein